MSAYIVGGMVGSAKLRTGVMKKPHEQQSSYTKLQMHFMLPVVYVDEAVDFEGVVAALSLLSLLGVVVAAQRC